MLHPWSRKESDITEQANNNNISLCPGKLNDFMFPFNEGPLRIHDLIQRIVNQPDTEGLKRQKGIPKHGIGSSSHHEGRENREMRLGLL